MHLSTRPCGCVHCFTWHGGTRSHLTTASPSLCCASANAPVVQAQAAAAATAAAGGGEAAAQAHALTVFRRPLLGASPRLSSAFELPAVVGALGYSLSPVQVSLPPVHVHSMPERYMPWHGMLHTIAFHATAHTCQGCREMPAPR